MNYKMTTSLSDKLKVISFICIVMVVWIHSYYTEGEKYLSTRFLMSFIGEGMCLVAVPMFYLISGYLFFLKTIDTGIKTIFLKQKKRIRSLLVPYVLANLLSVLFYFLLKLITVVDPNIQGLINTNLLDRAQGGFFHSIYYCFWDGPIAFQLWFVRYLMLFVLFAPIIYYVLLFVTRNLLLTIIGVIISLIIIIYHHDSFSWSLSWFFLGGILSMSDKLNVIAFGRKYWYGLICIIIAIASFLINALNDIGYCAPWVNKDISILFGIQGLWILYDKCKLIHSSSKIWNNVLGSTFFIYLIHEPSLNVFKKIPLFIGESALVFNLSYLLCPVIFIVAAVFFCHFIKNHYPKAYKIYTGGR